MNRIRATLDLLDKHLSLIVTDILKLKEEVIHIKKELEEELE
jgi:hypothetical protein